MTQSLLSQSPNDSSGSEGSDWTGLPEAEPVIDLVPAAAQHADSTDKVEAGICATCREPIVREPGARGRMPKFHPDCRPLRTAITGAAAGRNGKAEREADEAIAAFKSAVVKACIMLSMVDKYDAFCVMVALPQICDNLRGVLVRYDSFRKEMLALKGGGSVFALALSVLMCALPIAAHHGLIPGKAVAQILVNAPFTLYKIQEKLTQGEAALTKLMEEQLKQATEANRSKASADGGP